MSNTLGWIDPQDYSFNSFLLLERFQIRLMIDYCGWGSDKEMWKRCMGIALRGNPVVAWYFKARSPESASKIDELILAVPATFDLDELQDAEMFALLSVEDFIIHTTPEAMSLKCDYILGWNKEKLFELADFSGKTVLDVGAGSGRLSFAAAEKAAYVYASEPVDTLREFLRDTVKKNGIANIRVLDGYITELPFPDNTFDIVMSGHVHGDDWDAEIAEITRVCKPGGWLLNCPGDSEGNIAMQPELTSRGWEEIHYVGSFSFDVYIHRVQVAK